MATKLKNIWTKQSLKIVSFILAILFITLSFSTLYQMRILNIRGDTKNYIESELFKDEIGEIFELINDIYDVYISEENIRAGNTIKETDLDQYKERILGEFIAKANREGIEISQEMSITDSDFLKQYAKELENKKNELITTDLNTFKNKNAQLSKIAGLSYVVEKNGILTAFPKMTSLEELKERRVYCISNGGVIETSVNKVAPYLINRSESGLNVSFAFDNETIAKQEETYQIEQNKFRKLIEILNVSSSLAFITVVFLLISAGHQKETKEIVLLPIDALYIDLHGALLIIVELFIIGILVFFENIGLPEFELYLVFAIGVAIGLNFLLSLVRLLKKRTFKQSLLLTKIFHHMFTLIKKIPYSFNQIMKGSTAVKSYFFYSIAIALLGFTIPYFNVLSLLLFLLVLYQGTKKAKKYDVIMKGLEKIRNGDVDYKIVGIEGGLEKLAEGINAIGDGISATISKEVQSERLKTELITNVSHDIRTPLTSIITSIDLLKNKELSEEEKMKYLEILEAKAQRLKKLTNDLFDAAKAASGSVDVRLEAVDLEILTSQGLGEMQEALEASDIDFVINYPKELLIVLADGQLLWRVIENLLSNAFKYAQNKTRVYIDFEKEKDQGKIIFKNVSKQPLNILPEELTQRFKRGDETRSTEGSGLGLAIAKDLMIAQNGSLSIEIDGDLFKAILTLPRIK